MSGLGVSELYINGKRIGDAVLSPGVTEYPKRTFYVTHDVTEALSDGPNATRGHSGQWALLLAS